MHSNMPARSAFVLIDNGVINLSQISEIDLSQMVSHHRGIVRLIDGSQRTASGFALLELLMAVRPSALEGHRAIKWVKFAWCIHNLIGHPMMQICAWMGWFKLAMWWHDSTVPRPAGFKARGVDEHV